MYFPEFSSSHDATVALEASLEREPLASTSCVVQHFITVLRCLKESVVLPSNPQTYPVPLNMSTKCSAAWGSPSFLGLNLSRPPGMLKFAVAHGRLWSTLMIVTIMSQLPCSVALRKSCVWLVWVASVYPTKPTREIKPLVSVDNDLMWRAQNLRNTWGSTVEGNYSHCKDVVTSVMVPQLKSTGLPTTVARPGFPVSFGACMHHLHCHGLWPSPAELCWQLPHQALSPCPTG